MVLLEDAGEAELVEVVDKRREEDEECDNGNIIKEDGEAEEEPVAELLCSAEGTGAPDVAPGAEGVAAGQRRRSANAERDLRSFASTTNSQIIESIHTKNRSLVFEIQLRLQADRSR